MRVLFVSAAFWPRLGGVQIFAEHLLAALSARGHDFLVVAEQDGPDLPLDDSYRGIPVVRLSPNWRARQGIDALAEARQQVAQLKRSFRPQLVHSNAVSDIDFFHHTTGGISPCPWLVTLHGKWPHIRHSLVQRTLSKADWITGCSSWILEEARKLEPGIRSRSSVIHHGLDALLIPPTPLPFAPPHLLFVGRLSPEKRVDVAVDALAELAEADPSIRLSIAGDGPQRGALEHQAARLGIHRNVRFLGWVARKDIPSLINTATAVLLPSEEEAFGLAALEAAVMARPVVATRRGGLPEIVVHGKTGVLIDKPDASALAEAVALLLANPEQASQMGQAAREDAQAAFGPEVSADAYERLYSRLVTGTEAGARTGAQG